MSKNPPLPIALCAEDIPHAVLGYASTKAQARKAILRQLNGLTEGGIHIEKVDANHLLNTSGVTFWQYTTREVIEADALVTFDSAIALLNLEPEFDLVALKDAYRAAVKRTHPDAGGTESEFILVDRAYDLLQATIRATQGERWDKYRAENLSRWEKEFRVGWKTVCNDGLKSPAYVEKGYSGFRYGLWYGTFCERFARSHTEPLKEWFLHCVYPTDFLAPTRGDAPNHIQIRTTYREHLIRIAPNKLLAEVWARKYYQLEFGENAPWVFYLMPAREEVSA